MHVKEFNFSINPIEKQCYLNNFAKYLSVEEEFFMVSSLQIIKILLVYSDYNRI
jgi:hypothetical protein